MLVNHVPGQQRHGQRVNEQVRETEPEQNYISHDNHHSSLALIDSAVETVFAGTLCHYSNDDLEQVFFFLQGKLFMFQGCLGSVLGVRMYM